MALIQIEPYVIDITENFTFNNVTATGNLSSLNANIGNVAVANFFTGTLTTSSQPNITSVGTLTSLDVTGNVTLNADLSKHLCNTCDLMVNVSSSDANPTTLLETSAWGLPVACTPSSGYYGGEQFYEIPENNPTAAADVIRNIINMPSEELDKRRMANLELIRSHYTWDNFCNKIWDVLKLYL